MGRDRDGNNNRNSNRKDNWVSGTGHSGKDADCKVFCSAFYGREPFDLKLTVLRLIRNLWWVAAVTLAGELLFGGGYFVKHVLLRPQPQYQAVSRYYIEYAVEEEKDVSVVHINETSWNTYVGTGEFLEAVRLYLPKTVEVTDQELKACLGAVLASDLRVVATTVTTNSQERSLAIAEAVEQAMTREFPKGVREITGIRLIDPAVGVEEVLPDVRPVRAFVLSGILSLFFAVVVFLLKETGEDSIWLPALVEKRYGLKTVGTVKDPGFMDHMEYLFGEKKRVVICAAQAAVDPAKVLDALAERGWKQPGSKCLDQFQVVPAAAGCPENTRILRQAEGILLVLKAGRHAAGQLEYVKEYLERQDCSITAVLLWDADEWLIRRYYFGKN